MREDKYCIVYCGIEKCDCNRQDFMREFHKLEIERMMKEYDQVDFTKDVN